MSDRCRFEVVSALNVNYAYFALPTGRAPARIRLLAGLQQKRNTDVNSLIPTIQAGTDFQDNIARLPSIDHIEHIDLVASDDRVVTTIFNKPGQRGAMAICHYLLPIFGELDAHAAAHGVHFFGREYTADARLHPGAHPNIDLFLAIAAGGAPLRIVITANKANA